MVNLWRFEGMDWIYNNLLPYLKDIFGDTIGFILTLLILILFLAVIGGATGMIIKMFKG